MSDRISITHLTFVGHGRPDASVEFGPNVTIVRGPSDTGKSFIADSIDFMLGAQNLREIPQLTGYTTVLLGLRLPDEQFVTITRQVSGGGYTVYTGTHFTVPADQEGDNRGAAHDHRSDRGLSNYILGAIDLNGRQLRKNANNKKVSFTLRHLAHLTVIGETRMQARTAPPLTGQHTDRTTEVSALKLLLVGEDDSALEEVIAPTERRTIGKAKGQVVDQLLSEARGKIGNSPDVEQLRTQLANLNASIRAAGDDIDAATRARVSAAQRLAGLQAARTEIQRRAREIGALSSRFELLTQQYDSDLARLEMVSEAGNLLGYFSPETCPFCGAEPEHQHLNLEYGTDTTALAVVVAGERAKTEALRGDLQQAIEDLQTDARRLRTRSRTLVESIVASETALRTADEELRPRKNGFDQLLRTRSSVESAIAVHRQIADLELMRAQIEEAAKPKRAEPVDPLPLAAAGRFSTAIQERLRAWGFPGADSVRFDRNELDIVDAEQLRASHGKGVRAILHAAFSLALADVCLANDLPHPGFVVLDSPLVTYKPPKKGEAPEADDESARRLDDSFVARFYRSVQQTANVQIIIMENTDPPEELAAETIDIEFTDSSEGRRGFLATTAKKE
ncbi:ATP-binding protein [Kineosporia sp. R_H_3]|uniref:ATP-binding protein n=1 Tax=Kineosporia sp. R_H_3 TaxID=1961848 RepID=UPI000B4B2387|nr:ATP-binding protein [Kineosporia sp. R_H_3]